jgi:hypothetical protein
VAGFSRCRVGRDGRPRYTAYYLDIRGVQRSAGTFSSRKDADHAWQQVEVVQASGRPSDPRRGRLTFRTYVDGVWFPNHVMEASTRQSYRYGIDKHLMPFFGSMRMADVLPAHVREWVTTRVTAGVTPAMIRQSKIILSAIFTTALNDFVVALHPCRGVKTPTVPLKEYRILTPEEFDRLYAALPGGLARLLVDTAIESGLRWGRAQRAATAGPSRVQWDRHRQQGRHRGAAAVPPDRRSLRHQGLPEGPTVPTQPRAGDRAVRYGIGREPRTG